MNLIKLSILVIVSGVAAVAPAKEIVINIDHSSGGVVYSDLLEASKGDLVKFIVTNTHRECYSYNLSQYNTLGVKPATKPHNQTVEFVQPHDGRTSKYRISIKKRDPADTLCVNNDFERDFEFQTIGWNLSFSGAVTLDQLVNPVFFLEPGSQDNGMGGQTDGFFVRRNMGAEDERSIGFAAMAHLFHSERLSFPGAYDLKWAPISFGFGTAENSDTQLYLGTSLKFGERFFLTGGRVWGNVDRLPGNLVIDEFTEDANVLSSLGKRNDSEYFVGFSYQFGNVDLSKFTSEFETKQPVPTN